MLFLESDFKLKLSEYIANLSYIFLSFFSKMEETQQEKNKIKNFVEDQGKKHPWEFASDALKTLDDSKSDGNTTSKTINNGIESFGGIRNNYSSHGNYPYPNRYMGNSHERFNAQYPQYPQYPPNNWYPPPGPGYRYVYIFSTQYK